MLTNGIELKTQTWNHKPVDNLSWIKKPEMHTGKKIALSINYVGKTEWLRVKEGKSIHIYTLQEIQIQINQRPQHKTWNTEHGKEKVRKVLNSFAQEKLSEKNTIITGTQIKY